LALNTSPGIAFAFAFAFAFLPVDSSRLNPEAVVMGQLDPAYETAWSCCNGPKRQSKAEQSKVDMATDCNNIATKQELVHAP